MCADTCEGHGLDLPQLSEATQARLREFLPAEEIWRGPRVVILSQGLWQRQFGGDSSVVGGPATINGQPYTIVGVLPPFFDFLGGTEAFTPVQPNPAPEMRSTRNLIVIGRLRAGLDPEVGDVLRVLP